MAKKAKKAKHRNRDYSEYKSPYKGQFVTRTCLRCDKTFKLREQYRMCARCREQSDVYAMDDHSVLM